MFQFHRQKDNGNNTISNTSFSKIISKNCSFYKINGSTLIANKHFYCEPKIPILLGQFTRTSINPQGPKIKPSVTLRGVERVTIGEQTQGRTN